MKNFWRVILTGMVWLVLGGIAITAVINSPNSNIDATGIVMAAMVMGTLSTTVILVTGLREHEALVKRGHYVTTSSDEKAKRGQDSTDPRLAMLMDMMDEGELQAFKERLKRQILDEAYVTDDGEISYRGASMNDILDEAESVQYRRR